MGASGAACTISGGMSVKFQRGNLLERQCMEIELSGLDVTSEFALVTALKTEDGKQGSSGWLMEEIDGYALFNLDRAGRVVHWGSGAERLTVRLAKEITGQHFSCLYEGRETQMHKMPQFYLGLAVKQGFHEYQGWWLHQDAPHFLARVIIMPMGNREGDFAVMVWDMSRNAGMLAEMKGHHRTSRLDD